ncbi:MAG: Rpp14/Pop5 family protein [Nanobdellota archaeon]
MKTKPLLPSLREKKRYLAFEVISKQAINKNAIFNAILKKSKEMLGEIENAKAGIEVLHEKYNQPAQRGIIKVNHKYLEKLRASLCMISSIDSKKVITRSLGASGMINKAKDYVDAK